MAADGGEEGAEALLRFELQTEKAASLHYRFGFGVLGLIKCPIRVGNHRQLTMYGAHVSAHVITLHHKCGHKYRANTAGKNGSSNNKVNTGIFLYGRGRRRALGCNKVNQSL